MISRTDLRKTLDVSGETLRVWLRAGKLPPPDVNLSQRAQWWKPETLAAVGIHITIPTGPATASRPTSEASPV